jgi:hypothetical protein
MKVSYIFKIKYFISLNVLKFHRDQTHIAVQHVPV